MGISVCKRLMAARKLSNACSKLTVFGIREVASTGSRKPGRMPLVSTLFLMKGAINTRAIQHAIRNQIAEAQAADQSQEQSEPLGLIGQRHPDHPQLMVPAETGADPPGQARSGARRQWAH